MSETVGEAIIRFRAETTGSTTSLKADGEKAGRSFESGVKTGTRGLTSTGATAGSKFGGEFGKKAATSAHEKFKETAKYIVGPLVAAFAVEKVGEVVKESLAAAADLEAANRRNTLIFGKQREEVDKFGESAAKSYGLADLQARKAAAGFGILFKNAGLSREENAKSSVQMVKLASDLAAFNNVDPSTVFTSLQRGVAGSTRGLKPLGIIIDSTAIKAEALADGILRPTKDAAKVHAAQATVLSDTLKYRDVVAQSGKNSDLAAIAQGHLEGAQAALNVAMAGTVPPLTAQQKILASRNLILKQTTDQQGAFQRSSDGVIQQQRILSAEWSNAKDALGKGLMPLEQDLVRLLVSRVVPALEKSSHWFEKDGAPALHHFVVEAAPLVKQTLPALHDGLKATARVVGALAPDVAHIIGSFSKLPRPLQDAVIAGAGAAYLGKKTGLLGPAVKAVTGAVHTAEGDAAHTVLSKGGSPANPLYVWDVNGKGGGTPGAAGKTAAEDTAGAVDSVLKKVGFIASLAVGVQLAHGANQVVDSFRRRSVTPSPTDPQSLANSGIGGAQGLQVEHGKVKVDIDFDRLSASLIRHGSESPYAKQLLSELKSGASDTGGGFFGNNAVSKDQAAIKALEDAMTAAGKGIHPGLKAVSTDLDAVRADAERGSRSLDLLGHSGAANMQRLSAATDTYSKGLKSLPLKVETQVLTPGAVTSQTDIEHLQARFKLTPKQVTTLYKLAGLDKARADFDTLQGHIGMHRNFTETIELASRGVHVPAAAAGGVVPARRGGTLVRVGEAGQDEAIIPLDRDSRTTSRGMSVGIYVAGDYVTQPHDYEQFTREQQRRMQVAAFAGRPTPGARA